MPDWSSSYYQDYHYNPPLKTPTCIPWQRPLEKSDTRQHGPYHLLSFVKQRVCEVCSIDVCAPQVAPAGTGPYCVSARHHDQLLPHNYTSTLGHANCHRSPEMEGYKDGWPPLPYPTLLTPCNTIEDTFHAIRCSQHTLNKGSAQPYGLCGSQESI